MATDFRRNNLRNDLQSSIAYLDYAEGKYPDNKAFFIENRQKLQEILNTIMDEGKPVNDSVYNSAYNTLRQIKESELRMDYEKNKGKIFIYAAIFVVGSIGLYYWNKNRKK